MAHTENLDRKSFHITNIMLASVDGKIAYRENESTAERKKNNFVCPADFERLRSAIAGCDAVFVSSHTIAAENQGHGGFFRVADLRKDQQEPQWIIFTQSNNISFSDHFWKQTDIKKTIFRTTSFDMSEKPIFTPETFHTDEKNYYYGNISGLLNKLTKSGCTRFALLGGGKLNAAFWAQDLVNELLLTISPVVVGNSIKAPALVTSDKLLQKKLVCKKISQAGDFIFIDYEVHYN